MTSTALLVMDVQQGIVERSAATRADPQVHEVLLQKVFPRQARVTSIADWTAGLHQA